MVRTMKESEKIKILLVDDNSENLLALEAILENPDLELVKATSGQEGLALVLDHDFALIILDVQMPEMDGFETAELMRGIEKTKHIPIIFVTAINMEQKYIFKGYESGAVDYLFKPLEPEILKSKVKIFINLYRQNKIIKQQADELKNKVQALDVALSNLQKKEDQQKKLIQKLQNALDKVKTLSGLLPICAHCKNIRDDKGYWNKVESYISKNLDVQFSHGICPDCASKYYPEFFKDRGHE